MNSKFLLATVLFLNTFVVAEMAYAEHLTPIFSGSWYANATLKYVDACGQSAFDYIEQATSPAALANTLLSDVPQHANCQWSEIKLSGGNEKVPADFPGNNKDWQGIVGSVSSVMKAERDCLSSTGKRIDNKVTYLYPAYHCPVGSRASIDRKDGSEGCTTTPVVCNADVIGRALNVLGAGRLGHLGMTRGFDENGVYDQSVEVFQVKTGDPVKITLNPIDLFKNTPGANFWGEKFGVSDVPILTNSDANLILAAGLAQQRFPLTYTIMWDFHPGSDGMHYVYNQQRQNWENVLAVTNAKFRCDSFVYYSYLAGANLHIVPDFHFPLVPKDLLAAMQTCRNAEGEACLSVSSLWRPISANMQAAELASVLAMKEFDIEIADKASYAYIKNQAISRAAKLNLLWTLALKYQSDADKFNYLLDCLAYLQPVELIAELINQYSVEKENSLKHKIIVTLVSALEFSNAEAMIRANNYVLEVVKAQNFIRKVLTDTAYPETKKFLLQMYSALIPAEQAAQEVRALLKAQSKKLALTAQEKTLLELRLAFANTEQQTKMLPALLASPIALDNLCFMVSNLQPSWITDSVKPMLREALIANKTSLIGVNANSGCQWLSAYATLMVRSDQEKTSFMLNYIRQESDVATQAKLLSQLNKSQLSQLSAQDKAYYRTRFTQSLKAANQFSQTNKRLFQQGISSLYSQ